MTRDELLDLPPLLDVPTAAQVLGIGRALAYDLVRRGEWPTTVINVGRFIRIPTAPLLRLLEGDARVPAGDPQGNVSLARHPQGRP